MAQLCLNSGQGQPLQRRRATKARGEGVSSSVEADSCSCFSSSSPSPESRFSRRVTLPFFFCFLCFFVAPAMETSTACLVFATLLASACVCQSQPGLPKACKPSDECLAYGGYCISNSQKGDCDGLLFAKECKSALCSCCIEATLKRDECQEMPNICPSATSVCQDKDVGYECVCNAGFKTVVCGDIDECQSNPCVAPTPICVNTDGSYSCEALIGCDVGCDAGGN
ncbi:latent-transforming growth factor beta-binding protein 1-like isoform X1 [Macrobrachium nipponense]|uniref:latent-transforming growth factor beta-binding protein 1-like isoform X1 n=1 Tax=Macrobrachium nipponense TaxID=159736 RepID=UPI0030C8BB98